MQKDSQMVEVDSAELAVFKKKLKELASYHGRGTELISVYIPNATDRSTVMNQLATEMSQSSNIKSPQTRKNVQSALKKISNFLKQINFQLPANGIVVFSGNISEVEGRNDLRLFTVKPIKPLRTKLYWCDSSFHLDPLSEMVVPTEIYAFVVMDKREATIALLIGKRYEIVGHFTSMVAGKTRAGGQSAQRFERLREEAAQEFYRKVCDKVNQALVNYGDKLKGIIVGGPGQTKRHFLETEHLDYRLKDKVIGILDLSYTDESGIREIIQLSDEILRNTGLMQEKKVLEVFLREVVKDGLATYGNKEVEQALEAGKIKQLILSEGLTWRIVKMKCVNCGEEITRVLKDVHEAFDETEVKCPKCASAVEVVEETDYLDHLLETAHAMGTETVVVSTDTPEGEQFLKSFGGIGALLRYK
ncbi:MAG: peptide chain release factor 1 [Candidatus Iainarchaeum archaeon]|uniref:Peptide chain release factor subunit 1 n=1 Tax=Candidatus Iainarchaeum sp. TaxID=3101447 RepID=A0A7T9I2B2_9ARCH|nr:MAG: peptide chain release factor 1 [Candidatus Diapherotrites archaeon]